MTERLLDRLEAEGEALEGALDEEAARTPVYARFPRLTSPETFARVKELQETAPDEDRPRAGRFADWLASVAERAAAAPDEDRAADAAARASVVVRDETIPFGTLGTRIAETRDRAFRSELADAEDDVLADLAAPKLSALKKARAALARLVPGDYVAAKSALSGVDLRALAQGGERFLGATRDLFRDTVGWERSRVLDVPDHGRLAAHDFARLARARDEDARLSPQAVRHHLLEETERALGPAAAKGASFEDRRLGDAAVREARRLVTESLPMNRVWLRRVADLSPADADAVGRTRAASALVETRADAARLGHAVALADGAVRDPAHAYRERLSEALDADWPSGRHASDVEPELGAARRLRARVLEALLHRHLRETYDEDWFRNPRAVPFLRSLLTIGPREGAEHFARATLGETMDTAALGRRFEEALG